MFYEDQLDSPGNVQVDADGGRDEYSPDKSRRTSSPRTRSRSSSSVSSLIYELDSDSETLFALHSLSMTKVTDPVIGVLVNINSTLPDRGKYSIKASIVRLLKYHGASVKPIWLGQADSYYARQFLKINGLYVPDFPVNISLDDQTNVLFAVDIFCRLAIEQQNDKGIYWPIWGSGLGMQVLMMCACGKSVLSGINEDFTGSGAIHPSKEREQSVFLSNMNPTVFEYVSQAPIAPLSYKNLILLDEQADLYWEQHFSAILTCKSRRRSGSHAVAMIEAKQYPFYGTLIAPELMGTCFQNEAEISRNFAAVRFTSYLTSFFVNEACKNSNKMNIEEARRNKDLIDFYPTDRICLTPNETEIYYYFSDDPAPGQILPIKIKNTLV